MAHDGDELDRLRIALLHERSRAEHAERQLAELRAEQGSEAELRAEIAELRGSTSFRIGSRIVGLARPLRRRA